MQEHLMTILTFGAGVLPILIVIYGQTWLKKQSEAKLAEHGLTEAAKCRADLKAGLLTGAKAALLEGRSITQAIKAAITHTLASNADAATRLRPQQVVLQRLSTAAVADAADLANTAANAVKAGAAAGPVPHELTTVLHRALAGGGARRAPS